MKILKTTKCLTSILLLVSSACMKTPEINKDFGPEFTAKNLDQMLSAAEFEATKTSVDNIKKGEFAYFEKTNQVETAYPVVIKQRADTVTDMQIAHDNSKIIYTITQQLRELDSASGNMKPSQSQSTACLEKISGACEVAVTDTSFLGPNELMSMAQAKFKALDDPPANFGAFAGHFSDLSWKSIAKQATSADSSGIKWTYHNLKKTYATSPVPSLVSLRPDCGGRKNPCTTPMQTIQVTFDEVDWSSEQYPVKYSYNLVFSGESPFFGAQLLSCGSTTIPFQGQRIAILQCETLKDFTVGHDDVPPPAKLM